MSVAIQTYLDRVMSVADLHDDDRATEVRRELHDHLLTKVEMFRDSGVPDGDAVFKAIEETGDARAVGYALRPRWPLLDVRVRGTARGVVAVGPRAVGIFAFGGVAMGVFAFGGLAVGVVSWGGLAAALLWAWGAVGVSTAFAMGGVAIGTVASGMASIGVIAAGFGAMGMWAAGEHVLTINPSQSLSPDTLRSLETLPMNWDQMLGALVLLTPAFVGMWLGSSWLTRREQRRLRGVHPAFAD